MTDAQLRAAHQLVSLLDGDAVAQADANTYGNWFEHLTDYLVDVATEEKN